MTANATRPIRIAIVEDQAVLRRGLVALIGGTPGFEAVGDFGSAEEALAALGHAKPDVLLLDIELPGISGVDAVPTLRERFPELQIVMLTVFADNDNVFQALCRGAAGYLLKDTQPARLLEAIREVKAGGSPMSPEIARKVVATFRTSPPPQAAGHRLSPRETDILRLLVEGHSYKTAAAKLELAEDTIRFHIRHIYAKLQVHSKSEAVAKALRSGWV